MGTLNKYLNSAAVEEALDNGKTAFSELPDLKEQLARLEERFGEKKFRHIETVTVEDTGVVVINRSQEPDGTPYNFRKVLVRFNQLRGNTTSAGRIDLNTGDVNGTCTIAWRTDFISSSSDTLTTVRAELDGGFINGFSLYTKKESERVAPSTKSEILFNQYDSIHTIRVYNDMSSIPITVGSTLEIYAMDM